MISRFRLKIVSCLVFGALVSPCIAWALAAISPSIQPGHMGPFRHPKASWRWVMQSSAGIRKVSFDPMVPQAYFVPGADIATVHTDFPPRGDEAALETRNPPNWTAGSQTDQVPLFGGVRAMFWREEAYGWPLPCLRQTWHLDSYSVPMRVSHGFQLMSRNVGVMKNSESALPIMPSLGNLLFDTIIYAGLAFVAYQIWGRSRYFVRLKLGRCPRCGYDVRNLRRVGCPECGWNRTEP